MSQSTPLSIHPASGGTHVSTHDHAHDHGHEHAQIALGVLKHAHVHDRGPRDPHRRIRRQLILQGPERGDEFALGVGAPRTVLERHDHGGRCPFVADICTRQSPPLATVSTGHVSRCLRAPLQRLVS